MFSSESQLLQEIGDNFLKLLEILNEAQVNFTLTKEDLDIMIQFGRFKIIIAELKQINCSQGKHVSNVGKTKLVH